MKRRPISQEFTGKRLFFGAICVAVYAFFNIDIRPVADIIENRSNQLNQAIDLAEQM